MKFLYAYGAALLALAVLDAIWLTLIKGFYTSQIGQLMAPKVVWWAAILFYLLYAAAVVYFASSSAVSPTNALLRGALLGFTAYMTYDLVNLSTLTGWTVPFALVDTGWGTVITALAALAAFLV